MKLTETTPAPDRAEIEKALAIIRGQVAAARQRLDRLSSDQRHLFRKECVLLNLQDRPGEDIENISQQLIETRSELDRLRVKIDAIENEIEGLEKQAFAEIETLEARRLLPGILKGLTLIWGCRAKHTYPCESLPSFAADLLNDRLAETGRAIQTGENDLAAVTRKLKKNYQI
jgi:uncharacterized coiled-coil protein SlyX